MPPNELFKYTTASTAEIVLRTRKLRWSSPRIFNDPSEFQRIPRFEPSLKDGLNLLPEAMVKSAQGIAPLDEAKMVGAGMYLHRLVKFCIENGVEPKKFLEEMDHPVVDPDKAHSEMMKDYFGDNFIKQARVLCLTANPKNSAMWANYSELHQGCLLGFRHIPESDTPLTEAKKVTYSELPPVVGSGLDFLIFGGTPEILGSSMDGMCFAKKSDWSYEQEWRVVTWRSDEGEALFGDYSFFEKELASLTFGLKTTIKTRETLMKIISEQYSSCKFFEITHQHGELERVEV